MKKYLPLFILLFVSITAVTQENEKKDKEDKNFRYAGIPMIGYNRTVKFSFGILLNSYYKVNLKDTISPSSSTSMIGMYTTNKSYFGAVVQQFFLREDKWRLKLIGGFGNANLQVYHQFDQAGQYFDYTTLMSLISLDAKRRVYKKLYAGLSGSLMKAKTTFDVSNPETGEKPVDEQVLNHGGINFLWDSRDNINYPIKGLHVLLNNHFYGKWMGNDSSFAQIELSYNFYMNFKSERKVLLLRYYSKSSFGEVPFQGQNVVRGDDIRGYSKGKYRDNQLYSYQAEYRHRFKNRFGFVAFAGIAAVVPDMLSMLNTTYLPGIGVGARFMLIKKEKINMGIDVAVGRDDWSLTFRIGEAFSR